MFVVYRLHSSYRSVGSFILYILMGTQLINLICDARIYAQNKDQKNEIQQVVPSVSKDANSTSKNPPPSTKTTQSTVLKPSPNRFTRLSSARWPYPTPSFWHTIGKQLDLGVHSQYSNQQLTLHEFIGLDTYIPIQTRTRTWGHFVLQWYATRIDMWSFNDSDESQTNLVGEFNHEPMMVAMDFDLVAQGRLSLSFGHLKPYYGLRHDVHTTRTVLQLMDVHNLGLRFDWGVALHGRHEDLSYAVMLSRGDDRFPWETLEDTYLVSGRLAIGEGSLPFQLGLSAMTSQIVLPPTMSSQRASAHIARSQASISQAQAMNSQAMSSQTMSPQAMNSQAMSLQAMSAQQLIPRWRTGLDLQHHALISTLVELSIGRDFRTQPILNALAQFYWHSAQENWKLYIQQRSLTHYQIIQSAQFDAKQLDISSVGMVYYPLTALSIATEFAHQWDESNQMIQAQVRYRW